MNREIKFRAWDGKRITTSGIMFNNSNSFLEVPNGSQMKIMQYTGLKDKNGKEIYEGDILSIPNRKYERKGEFFNGNSSVYFEHGIFKCNNISLCTFNNFEIIGNIYQTPELL